MNDPEPAVSVVLDRALPETAEAEERAEEIFVDGDRVLVFTRPSVHVVDLLTGEVESSRQSAAGATWVEVFSVTKGADGFGAAVYLTLDGTVREHFCVLDTSGRLDLTRCSLMQPSVPVPRIVSDGGGYQVYVISGGWVRRLVYDSTPSLVSAEDLWSSEDAWERGIADVVPVAGGHLVVTTGINQAGPGCGTVSVHQTAGRAEQSRQVLPSTFAGTIYGGDVAEAPGRVAMLVKGVCLVVDGGECRSYPGQVNFLTTYDNGEVQLDAVPVWLSPTDREAVFLDGGRVVAAYDWQGAARLTRFEADGAPAGTDIRLPVAAGSNEITDVRLGLALGPDDYGIVYMMPGTVGEVARFARVRLTPP